jgi:putative thioredoxin
MPAETAALDITDATFAAEVLERSKSLPVVVDFWAPWCGPCRTLGPLIERVAGEHAGEVVLTKLNTDENPRVATQFRIQSIPAVKAFRDGKMVAEFVGSQPEPQVRAFFAKLVPTAAERAAKAAQAHAASGDEPGAERAFREALAASSINADAIVGLSAILLRRRERDEAEKLLDRVPNDRRAKAMKHRLFLEDFQAKHASEDLKGEAAANPRDPRAHYRWGVMLAAKEQYEAALDELLESVRLDKAFADGAARKAVLAVFDIVGLDSALTKEYQRKLASVLF